MIDIEIGDKKYSVQEAKTDEERQKGLQGVTSLPENEGMLFYFDEPQSVAFWMKDTEIPLDIIFIDDNQEVISAHKGTPYSEKLIEEDGVMYVLEVNQDSGISEGDQLEFSDDDEDTSSIKMHVLAPDGTSQMDLEGGERIVSRRETKVLIRKAKKAYKSKDDKDYKSLGKYMFKVLKGQDSRDPEYVDAPD